MLETYFEIAPVSLQSRLGMFFTTILRIYSDARVNYVTCYLIYPEVNVVQFFIYVI